MTKAIWAFVITAVLLAGGLTFVVLRGEDTRQLVRRTVDPCVHPKSDSCQRRIRLVLRELVRRHPGLLRKFDVRDRKVRGAASVPSGGDAFGSPTGGGPVGRVPSPGDSPPAEQPPSPPPSSPDALLDLDAPVVPRVCVGDLLAVNCK